MNKFLLGCFGFAALASTSFATLIPIGAIPTGGNGLGAVSSVVTFQNTGTESGCVGYVGGVTVVGSGGCAGGPVGGNEQTGAGNNTYTAADLGITFNGSRTFANLVLIFNGSEPQNAADSGITLSQLSLNLFSGSNVASFTTAGADAYSAFPGTGNAGFAYQLDSTQAAAANLFLQQNPNLRIGASATATNASGGLETIFVSTIGTTQPGGGGGGQGAVPEPSTYLLLAGGLISFGLFRKSSFRTR